MNSTSRRRGCLAVEREARTSPVRGDWSLRVELDGANLPKED